MEENVRIAAKGIILNEKQEFLILKRSNADSIDANLWDLPGGRLLPDETKIAGLKREIKEETGLSVEVIKLCFRWTYQPDDDSKNVINGFTYLCKNLSANQVSLSDEHSDYKWIKANEFSKFAANESLKMEVRKALIR